MVTIKHYTNKYDVNEGVFYDTSFFNEIITENTDGYITLNGKSKILFKFRKKVINDDICNIATKTFLSHSKTVNVNRGFAAGLMPDGNVFKFRNNTKQTNKSYSSISGYFDKAHQHIRKYFNTRNVCRTTIFTKRNKDKFDNSLIFFKTIDSLYKELAPIEYNNQLNYTKKIMKDMIINDTVFTTVTSNYNWRTACHRDKGDFENGLGNLAITGDDNWSGCCLGFPEYKVAIDITKGDFLLMDVHEKHCNTELIHKNKKKGIRLSFVCYVRKDMILCNTKKIINNEIYYYQK